MRLIRNSVLYGLSSLGNAAIPFVLLPLLTTHLSKASLGTVSLLEAVLLGVVPVIALGLNGAINVEYFRQERHEFERYLTGALLLSGISSATLFTVVVAAGTLAGDTFSIPIKWLLLLAPVAYCASIKLIVLSMWQAQGKALRFGVVQLTATSINLGLSVLLVAYSAYDWEGRAVGIYSGSIVAGVVAVYFLWADPIRLRAPSRDTLKSLLVVGLPLVPHGLAMITILYIDRFFLSTFEDVATVGIFVVAFQISSAITVLANALNQAWTPAFFKMLSADDADSKTKAVHLNYGYFAFVILGYSVLLAGSNLIFAHFVGPEFQAASSLVPLLATSFFIGAMYKPFVNVVFYERKTHWLLYTAIISGFVSVACNAILVPIFGVTGAAVSSLCANAALLISTVVAAMLAMPLPWLSALRQTKG